MIRHAEGWMSARGTGLKIAGGLLGLVVVAGGGGYLWASSVATTKLEQQWHTHTVDFPIPFPLSAEEMEALRQQQPGAELDFDTIARERAIERAKHLMRSRYVCVDC